MLTAAVPALLLQTPPAVLQRVRQALTVSGKETWAETRVTGSAKYYGVRHDYSLSFDKQGRYVQTFAGPVGETFGYDGTTFWRIDRSRGVAKLDFEDRDRCTAIGLVLTSHWLDPDAPVTISQDGYTLNLSLNSGQRETIKIDPKTGLPTEATFPVSSGNMTLRLKDWQAAGSRRIPTKVEIIEGGMTDSISVTKIASGVSGAAYSTPEWKPTDIKFDASKPATIEAKSAISGHILVHPLINGKDVGWFILDSGAEVMVLDKSAADGLKLKKVGQVPLTGIGGTIQSSFRQVDDFLLGPATMKNILFAEFDLAEIGSLLGIKLAGIVGGDFFKRSVVAVDLNGPSVSLHSRDTYALSSGKWLPMRFSTGNPAIEASADGSPKAWYRFDTGANGTVTFHTPFVKRHKLLDGKTTTDSGSGGVGGMVINKAGKINWFEIAGHRFENPTVVFGTANKGAFAEPYLAGNIGQDFMKPFKIILDFTGERIALVLL